VKRSDSNVSFDPSRSLIARTVGRPARIFGYSLPNVGFSLLQVVGFEKKIRFRFGSFYSKPKFGFPSKLEFGLPTTKTDSMVYSQDVTFTKTQAVI